MLRVNVPWIKPFQIRTPETKGGEGQPYLQRCFQDLAQSTYEILCPPDGVWSDVFEGMVQLTINAKLATNSGHSLLITTHPEVATGHAPTIIPSVFQTDWWAGSFKIWALKTDKEFPAGSPVALAIVYKRSLATTQPLSQGDNQRINEFDEYVSQNEKQLETRPGNLYERMADMIDTGQLRFGPKKTYRIL